VYPLKSISYDDFEEGPIDFLKDLCNGLMTFQAERALIRPDVMASMNFENRFLPDYNSAESKYVAVARDGLVPVGFAYAAVGSVDSDSLTHKPEWAADLKGTGFYPEDYDVPARIGTFKLLFISSEYRGMKIGEVLSDMIMTWLGKQRDLDDLWVYVANGNEVVGRFYEKLGFNFSHSVFDGLVSAYRKPV